MQRISHRRLWDVSTRSKSYLVYLFLFLFLRLGHIYRTSNVLSSSSLRRWCVPGWLLTGSIVLWFASYIFVSSLFVIVCVVFAEGMCAGIRDVANLAWKLATALQLEHLCTPLVSIRGSPLALQQHVDDINAKGAAVERLLESYESERRPHVR